MRHQRAAESSGPVLDRVDFTETELFDGYTDLVDEAHSAGLITGLDRTFQHGTDSHAQVLAAGVKISGCTVHFVRTEMDAGPIIVQAAVPVLAGDDEDSLAARVLTAEHQCYPRAVRLIAENRVTVEDGRVVVAGGEEAVPILFNPPAD